MTTCLSRLAAKNLNDADDFRMRNGLSDVMSTLDKLYGHEAHRRLSNNLKSGAKNESPSVRKFHPRADDAKFAVTKPFKCVVSENLAPFTIPQIQVKVSFHQAIKSERPDIDRRTLLRILLRCALSDWICLQRLRKTTISTRNRCRNRSSGISGYARKPWASWNLSSTSGRLERILQ